MSKPSKYVEIFVREAEDHLGQLRQALLELEQQGAQEELINQLLRSAHTLKGSANMVDLGDLSGVAHRMEDLLKQIQRGEQELTPDLIDILLVATDAIEALTAQAHSGNEVSVNVDKVNEALQTGRLAEETAAQPAPATDYAGSERRKSVRASVERLDQLVNSIGEVLLSHQALEQRQRQLTGLLQQMDGFLGRLRRAENYRAMKAIRDVMAATLSELEADNMQLGYQAEDIYQRAMELRLLPLATLTDDFQRSIRNLSRTLDKEVRFQVQGQNVELDRTMLDAVKPILLHVLNNAVDHGIEEPETRHRLGKPKAGEITLDARYEGNFVQIRIQDDGRGIDPDEIRRAAVKRGLLTEDAARAMSDEAAIYLVLEPGFSTREFITDVSGRGVGLDVVKANLDQVKGNLALSSTPGVGTELVLRLPLSTAIFIGLLLEAGGTTFICPQHYVSEILRISPEEIREELGRETVRIHDRSVPLQSLAQILDIEDIEPVGRRLTVLVLNYREQRLALLVDRTVGLQEVVVKSLGSQLKSVQCLSGATLLGDGTPALILSVTDLFALDPDHAGTTLRRTEESGASKSRGRILVVDDSITTRTMEKNILETHGYEVMTAVSGTDALEKLAGHRFDLMVSDVEMPGMTGFELTKAVRQQENTADLPVIIVTSLASDEHRRAGIDAGAQAYIVKGNFEQGLLLETVETLIG